MAVHETSRFRGWWLIAIALAFVLALLIGLRAAAGGEQSRPAPSPPQTTTPAVDFWAPDWMMRELWGPGRTSKSMMVRMLRHLTFMNYGVPADYDGARSNVPLRPETTAAGGVLYAANCRSCHGANGLGDGEAGRALSPSPALLAYMVRRPISVDEYLLWSIADGGKQFESEMPAFKDKLSRDEIWKIVAYMRAGFPDTGFPETGAPAAKP